MSRVKRGVTARARHKKILAEAKGFRGRRSSVFRVAKEAVMKAANMPIVTVVTKACIPRSVDYPYQRCYP